EFAWYSRLQRERQRAGGNGCPISRNCAGGWRARLMAEWLLLRRPRTPTEPASGIHADARGNTLAAPQSGPLSLAPMPAGRPHVCVLVPGTDVLLAQPELPAKAGAKLQQIVPYALEEQLAEDIDNLHFAIGRRSGDSTTVPVAVVSQSLMDEWLTS